MAQLPGCPHPYQQASWLCCQPRKLSLLADWLPSCQQARASGQLRRRRQRAAHACRLVVAAFCQPIMTKWGKLKRALPRARSCAARRQAKSSQLLRASSMVACCPPSVPPWAAPDPVLLPSLPPPEPPAAEVSRNRGRACWSLAAPGGIAPAPLLLSSASTAIMPSTAPTTVSRHQHVRASAARLPCGLHRQEAPL